MHEIMFKSEKTAKISSTNIDKFIERQVSFALKSGFKILRQLNKKS